MWPGVGKFLHKRCVAWCGGISSQKMSGLVWGNFFTKCVWTAMKIFFIKIVWALWENFFIIGVWTAMGKFLYKMGVDCYGEISL